MGMRFKGNAKTIVASASVQSLHRFVSGLLLVESVASIFLLVAKQQQKANATNLHTGRS
jgi:hypothetical protein